MNLKLYRTLYFIVLSICLVSYQTAGIENETIWSSKFDTKSYHWKAETMNLDKQNVSERYFDTRLIGAANMEGGDIEISVQQLPGPNFNFFLGERLELDIGIEGDAAIIQETYNSDYNLFILPIRMNGSNFFDMILDNISYLENLTQSTYIDYSELDDLFTLSFIYMTTLSVNYTWNIESGFMEKKIIQAESGNKIIIIPGKGKVFSIGNDYNFNFIQLGIGILIFYFILIIIKNRI